MTAITFSDSVDKLMSALIAAQAEFPSIPKDGYNPHFKSKFSTLAAVKKATQPVLVKHQLAVTQFPSMTYDGKPALTTLLAHASGQYMYDVTALSMVKSDPQAQGSAITYLRRYAWSAVLGLVTDEDDDDGNTATIVAPKVTAAKLKEIGGMADDAGISREEVADVAMDKFGKKMPQLTPQEADAIVTLLARRIAEKELAAKEVTV